MKTVFGGFEGANPLLQRILRRRNGKPGALVKRLGKVTQSLMTDD